MSVESYDKRRVPVSQRTMSHEATIASDGNMVPLTIDGQAISVAPGTTVLDAAKQLSIHIPTLCTHEDLCVVGNCRICVVEIEGFDSLQAACAFPITESISVNTYSTRVRTARRHLIQLLLAHHTGECYGCSKNGSCELSDLAGAYGVDNVVFAQNAQSRTVDTSSQKLNRNMNKCVLCRRCVRACIDMQEVGVMEAVGKGDQIEIETFGNKPLKDVVCIGCGQCIARCPTAALTNPDDTQRVWEALDDPHKHVMLQLSPSVRSAVAETLGYEPGTLICEDLISVLRRMGFNKVYDTQLAVSLIVKEQAKQLLLNLYERAIAPRPTMRPVLSSNCCGWVKYVEYFVPSFLQYLSPLKSDEQLLGTLIRSQHGQDASVDGSAIVSVAVVPCSSKKSEADAALAMSNGLKNIDYAITTVELGKMIKESGISLPTQSKGTFDEVLPFDDSISLTPFNSMLHMLFGLVYQMATDQPLSKNVTVDYTAPFGISGAYIMSVNIDAVSPSVAKWLPPGADAGSLKGLTLRFGRCDGTANAKKVIENIRRGGAFTSCDYIEFSACPDGCFGGGGQPGPTGKQIRQARKELFPALSILNPTEARFIDAAYEKYVVEAPSDGVGITKDQLTTSFMPKGKFIK